MPEAGRFEYRDNMLSSLFNLQPLVFFFEVSD